MKLWNKWFLPLSLMVFMLTACGTAEVDENAENGTTGQAEIEEPAQEEQTNQENTNEENEADGDQIIRLLEQNLQYTMDGETKEETAFLVNSDNQAYSLYVLPEFELTAEEPNKDVLYVKDNESIFMRIELLPHDADWDMAEQTMKDQLTAVNEEVKEITLPEGDFYKDAIALEASSEESIVAGYLIKNDQVHLKLTLFSDTEQTYDNAFLKMAETIMYSEEK